MEVKDFREGEHQLALGLGLVDFLCAEYSWSISFSFFRVEHIDIELLLINCFFREINL